MEKYIYNEQNGLWYELQGDYYIPCLVLDEEDTKPIGMWGRKRLDNSGAWKASMCCLGLFFVLRLKTA